MISAQRQKDRPRPVINEFSKKQLIRSIKLIQELKVLLNGDDFISIDKKCNELNDFSSSVIQKTATFEENNKSNDNVKSDNKTNRQNKEDDVVDADYEEVKNTKKNKDEEHN